LIVTGNGEGTIRIHDPILGEQALVLRPRGGVRRVRFAPDGKGLYLLGADNTLHLYEVRDPTPGAKSGK
jgi:hypothetical protein